MLGLASFTIIALFGLLYVINSRLSGVSFSLSDSSRFIRYFLRYLTDSSANKTWMPTKFGILYFEVISILQGIGVPRLLFFPNA